MWKVPRRTMGQRVPEAQTAHNIRRENKVVLGRMPFVPTLI